jgi:hypothetical protein
MPRARPKFARVALCLFCAYHVAAITVANVPRTTALGAAPHALFGAYVHAAGLAQTWDMFTTIPRFRSLRGSLVVEDENGRVRRADPVVPGFRSATSSRVKGTFMRLAFSAEAYPGYAERYLGAICRAFAQQRGALPRQVGFELVTEQLRPLADVRRDGRMSESKTFTFGPAPCAR